MPATEQTWRDSKLLHVIFGISSLAMLMATIWMLADDHNREWKQYQREFREVETWTAQSRNAFEISIVRGVRKPLLGAPVEMPAKHRGGRLRNPVRRASSGISDMGKRQNAGNKTRDERRRHQRVLVPLPF